MIHKYYKYVIKMYKDNTYEVLEDVIYESKYESNNSIIPFDTYEEVQEYILENNLTTKTQDDL